MYLRIEDDIWAAVLAGKGSLSSKNQGIKYLLCVIKVFTKYTCTLELNLWRMKKLYHFLMVSLEYYMNLNVNQINDWLIKEDNFTKTLCKNG